MGPRLREPWWSPRGPIVCIGITGHLLIRRFPQLRPLVRPLKLQTPYLFLFRRISQNTGHDRSCGSPNASDHEVHCQTNGLPLHFPKTNTKTELLSGLHVGDDTEASRPEACKEVKEAHVFNTNGSFCSRECCRNRWGQAMPLRIRDPVLFLERAASAALSNSSTDSGNKCCCGSVVDRVFIQLVDARHCPGSAMLLLRCAPVGSYVHIGDFCCTGSNLQPLLQQVQQGLRLLQQLEDPEAAAAAAAVASDDSVSRAREHSGNVGFAGTPGRVASQQEEPHADVLYFDSTYLHPRFSFLSKEDAVAEMCQRMEVTFEGVFQNLRTRPTKGLLRGHRSRSLHVVVGVDNLGKESRLQQLGKALRAPIGLSEAQSDSAAAVAAAAAQANGTCAYSIEDFTRGLYCPVIRAVMSWIFTSTSWGSSSDNSTAVREMPACGCPWPNESRSATRPGHPQEQPWHEASQEDVEMLVGLSGEASQAAVPLFAVPRRLLLKVVSALEASALSALGLLPSGGISFRNGVWSVHSVSASPHSSFYSLLDFARGVRPQKAVLLEPLPVPSCACTVVTGASLEKGIHEGELAGSSSNNDSNSSNNSSSNSVDGYQNYRGVSQKVVARTRKLPERGNPNSSMQTNSVGTPITLLLDRIEAEEMILAVGVEGSEALNNNNSSAELAAMVGCYSPSVVASVPRGPVARSKAPSVCGAFNYDGREGSAAFVEATELPIVVLGSGRRLFCPHGCPRRCLRGSCTYMCRKRNRTVACSAEDSRRMEVKAYGSPSVLPDSREPGVPPQARITPELVTGTGNETSVLPFRKVSRAVRRLRFVSRA